MSTATITNVFRYFIFTVLVSVSFFIASSASAQVNINYSESTRVVACDDPYGLCDAGKGLFRFGSVDSVIANVILAVLSLVGIIFLVLIIYGGLSWMTSGGNEQRIEKAKKILTTATIGLVIIVLGYSITFFVVESLTEGARPSSGAQTIQ